MVAARSLALSVGPSFPGGADLALVFVTPEHAENIADVADTIRGELGTPHVVAVTANGVIAGMQEFEKGPAMSVLAASLPGATVRTFSTAELGLSEDGSDGEAERVAAAVGPMDELRALLLFVDPFTTPTQRLLTTVGERVQGAAVRPVVMGGVCSGGGTPGSNRLLHTHGRLSVVHDAGVVGVAIRGAVQVDAVVSQGCRPFGPLFVVTRAKQNALMELGGRPALAAIREACEELEPADRKLLGGGGLMVGRVVNEYKDRLGRGDFLVRPILGADESSGSVAVAEALRPGQRVQLHLRDASTASKDLGLLLDAQSLYERPAGALLITCNQRGEKLFGRPHHDVASVQRAFRGGEAAEQQAKPGSAMTPAEPLVPLAGCFVAGEIGPVGASSYVHSQTACVALFRPMAS